MNYKWLDSYLLTKKGAIKDYHADFQAYRYMVSGKMFALLGEDNSKAPIINLKLEPLHGAALRDAFSDIKPGYYMNKIHWNSLYLNGEVPYDVVKEMADESYRIIFQSLPKYKQKEILEK